MTRHIKKFAVTCTCILLLTISTLSLAQSSQIQGPRDNTQVYSGVVYGPIDPSDTLWRIASRYKEDSQFTIYQVMLAIYELNQQAFENGNFNTMVNGATLRLPADSYIARMDPQQARAKAEQDDRAFGRRNSIQEPNTSRVSNTPVVSAPKSDQVIADLKSELNAQIKRLHDQQQQSIRRLNEQVSASVNTLEILVSENQDLVEQVDALQAQNAQINDSIQNELKPLLDLQQARIEALEKQLLEASPPTDPKEASITDDILKTLLSPVALVITSSIITLLALFGLFMFMLKRTKGSGKKAKATDDIIDDDLVIGELEDETTQDSDELLAALEEQANAEEDDILSDELADDEVLKALNTNEEDDFGDGMLVPDLPKSASESRQNETQEDDVVELDIEDSSTSNVTQGPKDNADAEALELETNELIESEIKGSVESASVESGTQLESDTDEVSANDDLDGTNNEFNPDTPSGAQNGEAGEITGSDDVSEQSTQNTENDSNTSSETEVGDNAPAKPASNNLSVDLSASVDDAPPGIDLDDNDEIDETTLEQIGEEIRSKDEKINRLADELIEELDNVDPNSLVDEQIDDSEESDDLVSLDDDIEKLLAENSSPMGEDSISASSEDELNNLSPAEDRPPTGTRNDVETVNSPPDSSEMDISEANSLESENIEGLEASAEEEVVDLSGGLDDEDFDESDEQLEEFAAQLEDEINEVADALSLKTESAEDAEDNVANSRNADSLDKSLDEEIEADELASQPLDSEVEGLTDIESNSDNESAKKTRSSIGDDAVQVDAGPEPEPEEATQDEIDNLLNASDDSSKEDLDDTRSHEDAFESDEPFIDEGGFDSKVDEELLSELDEYEELRDDNELETPTDLDNSALTNDKPTNVESDELESTSDTEINENSKAKQTQGDPEIDVLADLPDLDDWLDEDDAFAKTDQKVKNLIDDDASLDDADTNDADVSDKLDDQGFTSNDEELLAGLDDVDFDDLLEELANEELGSASEDTLKKSNSSLDLEALMTEEEEGSEDNFVDVDQLLEESESAPQSSDSDFELNLDKSLDHLINAEIKENSELDDSDPDQASNLDLAQVYIDMEDGEAAREILNEVIAKGSEAQVQEAITLLEKV